MRSTVVAWCGAQALAVALGPLRPALAEARLTQVEAYASDEAALIYVKVLGDLEPELRQLREPPRVYADFPGTTWAGKSEVIETGGAGGLQRVRWALYQERPPVTRVVVDLAPQARATLSQVGEGLYLIRVLPGPPKAEPSPADEAGGQRVGAAAEDHRTTGDSPPFGRSAPKWGQSQRQPHLLQQQRIVGAHVVLDPAGGGDDLGGQGTSTTGKAVNLDVAVRAAVALMDAGALVTLTRDRDAAVTAAERAQLAQQLRPDVVVRIECALTGNPQERGIETRYTSPRAAELAAALQRALVRTTGAHNQGIAQAAGSLCPASGALAVTCVVGQLSSPEEGRQLASVPYRERLAVGIRDGVAAYLGAYPGTSPPTGDRGAVGEGRDRQPFRL